jgi:hypothetical protein
MSDEYWKKGDGPKDPDFGKPNRHTRAKIRLLMKYLDAGDVENVLLKVAERHPETVLKVMCDLMEDAEEILESSRKPAK